jgi:hypothetical protein
VVVYKVDRLTRSLADFAKIVDVLDAHGASFVSVTQQFNTTTSMGRLTLNMLLSFAQFEREIAGERIRDKIAASKAKGMWMGGNVPLGYDVKDRKLVVNGAEADTVRLIFRRCGGFCGAVEGRTPPLGVVGKRREEPEDVSRVASRSPRRVCLLLQNRIYRGEISTNTPHPGQHEAIIDAAWRSTRTSRGNQRDAPLHRRRGRACWGADRRADGGHMTPTHAANAAAYRYYVSASLLADDPY